MKVQAVTPELEAGADQDFILKVLRRPVNGFEQRHL